MWPSPFVIAPAACITHQPLILNHCGNMLHCRAGSPKAGALLSLGTPAALRLRGNERDRRQGQREQETGQGRSLGQNKRQLRARL